MIPPPFEYFAPTNIPEAVALLDQDENAKVLAGGQSLIPMLRFRLASPAALVDINRIRGLDYIREEDGWLKIGALTRESELEESESDPEPVSTPGRYHPYDCRSTGAEPGDDGR